MSSGCNYANPGIAAPKCTLESGNIPPPPVTWTLEVHCSDPDARKCLDGPDGSHVVLATDESTALPNCSVTRHQGVPVLSPDCGAPSQDTYVCQHCPPLGSYNLAWTS